MTSIASARRREPGIIIFPKISACVKMVSTGRRGDFHAKSSCGSQVSRTEGTVNGACPSNDDACVAMQTPRVSWRFGVCADRKRQAHADRHFFCLVRVWCSNGVCARACPFRMYGVPRWQFAPLHSCPPVDVYDRKPGASSRFRWRRLVFWLDFDVRGLENAEQRAACDG